MGNGGYDDTSLQTRKTRHNLMTCNQAKDIRCRRKFRAGSLVPAILPNQVDKPDAGEMGDLHLAFFLFQ